MPKTSAVALLPVQSKPANRAKAGSNEALFQETLQSARQQKTARKTDEPRAEKPDKSAASQKQAGKPGKSRRANGGAENHAARSDDEKIATRERKSASIPADDSSVMDADQSDASIVDGQEASVEEHDETDGDKPATGGVTVAAQSILTPTDVPPAPVVTDVDGRAQAGAVAAVVVAAGERAGGDEDEQGQAPADSSEAATEGESSLQRGAGAVSSGKSSVSRNVGLGASTSGSRESIESGGDRAGVESAASTTTAAAPVEGASAVIGDALSAVEKLISSDDGAEPSGRGASIAEPTPMAGTFQQHLERAAGPGRAAAPAPLGAEARFVDANHPRIVTGVRSELLPGGGTMQIRLDPPELGALQVTVHLRDGVMTAAFQTSNDQATRMLSHSLSDLRTVLESTGVSVERLHVQQSPKQDSQGGQDQQQQGGTREQQQEARQEQQRREMLQRMWRKLAGAGDPIDFVG